MYILLSITTNITFNKFIIFYDNSLKSMNCYLRSNDYAKLFYILGACSLLFKRNLIFSYDLLSLEELSYGQ